MSEQIDADEQEYRLAIAKIKCEEDHLFFCRYFFKARQGIKFIINWHHHVMADAIQDVFEGRKKNLVITVSPGSSKTELVVINTIARGLALNPRARFLHLSGSDSLASLNSATARDIVRSTEFQELWPMKIAEDADSKKRWNVVSMGKMAGGVYATSLGGQVTGFRAGHMAPGFQGCFVGSTRILTNKGSKRIDEIKENEIVVSYNHTLNVVEFKKVLATKATLRSDIAETILDSGIKIRSTPCHRFYDGKSYRRISSFDEGDSLYSISRDALAEVSSVQEGLSTTEVGNQKKYIEKSEAHFLFRGLFKLRSQVLRQITQVVRHALPRVLEKLSTGVPSNKDVFGRVCKPPSFKKNAGKRKFKLQGFAQRLFSFFRSDEEADFEKGSRSVFDLLSVIGKDRRPPSGRQQGQQQSREFGDPLQQLSYHSSQILRESISSIEQYSGPPTTVYDIHVEGNHNFFAEGILVHNCILIDDPVKPEDSFSRSKLDASNRKLITTVKSRKANPDTPIILVMQRIAESDPAGFILGGGLEGQWHHINLPAVLNESYKGNLEPRYQAMIPESETFNGRFSYWPYKEHLSQLLAMESGQGTDRSGSRISRHVFNSQYQQAPTKLGGNIIKGEYFERYSAGVHPKLKWRKVFADTAQKTKEQNDYSVFMECGLGVDGKGYLLDLIRGKWEAPELQRRAIAFWGKCKARDVDTYGQLRKMVVEDKSSGTGLIQTLKLPPHNIPLEALERHKDKVTRVMDALPYIEARQFCVPEEAPFTNDFIAECESFTADNSHDHDDQVDPLVDAVMDLLSTGNKLKIWESVGG